MNAGPYRLPRGGRIDPSRPVTIRFDGREWSGFAGDTVASLLLSHGIHHVARSFKYHRPRGILSHGSDEPSGLLEADRGWGRVDPNNRATVLEARDGLFVRSQHRWPSLGFDLGAITDRLAPLVPAGFPYKTFMWPRSFWTRVYEPLIRRAAGLGRAPAGPDPDRYAHRHAHCDVLVVGAGPAGLAAALAASEGGRRVILADEGIEPGGTLLHDLTSRVDGLPVGRWLADTVAMLAAREHVTVLPRTTAFGYGNHNHLALAERVSDGLAAPRPGLPRERLWQVRAREVVLATGSHERPLVFANNDRPGIMLAESVRAYLNRWAVAPGRNIVFATTGDSAYRAALDAQAAGLGATIVDLRPEGEIGPLLSGARAAGIPVLPGHTVLDSHGRRRVGALDVAPVGPGGRIGPVRTLDCDCVGMSGGWTPAVHLFSQSRGTLRFDAERDAFLPDRSVQAERSAGAARGTYELGACLEEGYAAGFAAAGAAAAGSGNRIAATPSGVGFRPVRTMPADRARGRAFVDFGSDVTAKDIRLAVQEGFRSIEHAKRYTTAGMAPDQGKTSNMNALGLVADERGATLPSVGTTTFRPPYTPVTFGTLVGPNRHSLFEPVRTTPIHPWAEAAGGVFENVGLWRRAGFFPRPGEGRDEAVARECRAVRERVGLLDASTLGKIEVVGPDAAAFLDRLYPNALRRLAPGRCRYGLLLKEDGFVMDDGVVARLAPDRFHVTTTTGGAARVLNHMEDYLQTEWPELDVFLTSVTEQWAAIAVQGPRARDVLAPLVSGIDLSPEAFPHMSVRTGEACGVPCRLFRVSFTGELGYEVNVPADDALSVWEAVWASGQAHGIAPYGTESMHVLRAEKGFVVIGQETDGTVTPDDLGLSGTVGRTKGDFVGKRSLARPDLVAPGRRQLVGLLAADPGEILEEGAQVVRDRSAPGRSIGHVTSSCFSPAAGRGIALALVANGRALHGRVLAVTTPDGFTEATVCGPVFLPGEGSLHA